MILWYKVVLRGVPDVSSKSKSVLQACFRVLRESVLQSVPQECRARVSGQSVSQKCQLKVSHKSVSQEYATRVSRKSVPHDCPRRAFCKSGF